MPQCAFLTLERRDGFVMDDHLAHEPLLRHGWQVHDVPWRRADISWSSFDAVVVRSTWDYTDELSRFLGVLERIEAEGVPLFNPLALIRWNAGKTYLAALATRGVATIPTMVLDRLTSDDLPLLFGRMQATEIVVKPVVGANSVGTFRLHQDRWHLSAAEVAEFFSARPALVQPFVNRITTDGEYSLFYFDGVYSHAVRKVPALADFRVQEEHGASITAIEANDAMRSLAGAALATLPQVPLYARVDVVRAMTDDGYWLMELELVEPSLYLRMDPDAPMRFAEAFVRRAGGRRG
jgi:glutathione synthase/RimK-type ligase-like ATP-grasp enzyme